MQVELIFLTYERRRILISALYALRLENDKTRASLLLSGYFIINQMLKILVWDDKISNRFFGVEQYWLYFG